MVDFIATLVIAILSGLGVGSGGLLILWLTEARGTEQLLAQGINLVFFLAVLVSAALLHLRRGSLPVRLLVSLALCGGLGAVCGALLSGVAGGWWTRLLFALFLCIAGSVTLVQSLRAQLRGREEKKQKTEGK